jgi:hypothetical protein
MFCTMSPLWRYFRIAALIWVNARVTKTTANFDNAGRDPSQIALGAGDAASHCRAARQAWI